MKRILIIDDDWDLADTIKAVLEYADYDVLLSHKAQQGINLAKEQKPDLILMDVMMPGTDGAAAVRLLKEESALKDIPVIFLTALVSDDDTHSEYENIGSLNVGGIEYPALAKPFENERLLEKIKAVLQLH